MNDMFGVARFVSKAHTSARDAFRLVSMAITGEIAFFERDASLGRPHFGPDRTGELARVVIIVCQLGISPAFLDLAITEGAAGVVFAGTGNGKFSRD